MFKVEYGIKSFEKQLKYRMQNSFKHESDMYYHMCFFKGDIYLT